MAKQRTSGIQRRQRASTAALNRRIDSPGGLSLPDWRLLAIGGVLLIGVLTVALVLLLGSGTNAFAGEIQPDDGGAHVTPGVDCRNPANENQAAECGGADPYSSVPAVSGPMAGSVANWGVYTTPQLETELVHNVEHGGIVIWYDPERVDADAIDVLTRYVNTQVASGISGRFKFILTPWGGSEELPAPIVVTAWRHILELDEADTAAIDEFARARYGRSPEPNGGPGPP